MKCYIVNYDADYYNKSLKSYREYDRAAFDSYWMSKEGAQEQVQKLLTTPRDDGIKITNAWIEEQEIF